MIKDPSDKRSVDSWCNNGRGMRVLLEMNKAGMIKQLQDPQNISWGKAQGIKAVDGYDANYEG